jgi:uncharacterized protein (TIGR02145 family)
MKTAKRFPTLAAIFAALAFTFFACSSDGGGSPGAEPDAPGVGSDNPAGDPEAPSSGGEQSSSSSAPAEPPAPKCGGEEYDPATHDCHAGAAYPKCVEGADEACFANGAVNISVPKCAGNPQGYDPSLYECQEGKNGVYLKGGLEDGDGNKYAAVLIGTQTWMAENLNYNASGSKCNNCDTYGRLYNWATAMDNAASSSANPSGVQGVCPDGWHLPSDAEWTALTTAVGTDPGKKLKASSSLWTTNTGTDDYGFSALPGGYGYSSSSFLNVGTYGFWWSSTQDNATDAYYRKNMGGSSSSVSRINVDKSGYNSVRCLQD